MPRAKSTSTVAPTPTPFPTPALALVPPPPAAAPTQPCLICGMAMVPVVLGPHTAPWLCPNLAAHRNGFWQSECDARADYLPATRSFAHRVVVAVRAAVELEYQAALARGTSLRPDQLRHLSQEHLVALGMSNGVDTMFRAQARLLAGGG